MKETKYSYNSVVREVPKEAFFYHGEWELPGATVKLTMPNGYDAGCLMNCLRHALTALAHNSFQSVEVDFNGMVTCLDTSIGLPATLQVYGRENIWLMASVNDETVSQRLMSPIVGRSEHAIAKDVDELDALLRKGGDAGPWMQRDIVCALQKPRRKLLKGEEVHGLEIPFCLHTVVSRWKKLRVSTSTRRAIR